MMLNVRLRLVDGVLRLAKDVAEVLLEVHLPREVPAHCDLVSNDQVSNLDAFLRLLHGLFVPVELRENGAELQP